MFEFPNVSHMPFISTDGVVFCCLPVNGIWKLHVFINGAWQRIYTGQPEDATECGPCAEYDEGVWRISFIAGGSAEKTRFYLYRMLSDMPNPSAPSDVSDLSAIAPAMSGFSREMRTVSASRSGPVEIGGSGQPRQLIFHDAQYYYRISFNPHDVQQLIISGSSHDNAVFTRSFHLITQEAHNITINAQPAYKCALWRNECYYARQTGPNFEDRTICAGDAEFTPLGPALLTLKKADVCKYAEDTGHLAFANIPCRGNEIICRRDGHSTFARNCSAQSCSAFEPEC